MATLKQTPKFETEELCNSKYPNIALIETLTNKGLICRLDFKKTSVNKIIENLIKKIGYNAIDCNLENISFIHNGKKLFNKNKTLKDLGCSDKLEKLKMFYDFSGIVRKPNLNIDEKTILKKIKNSKDILFVKTLTGETITLNYTNDLQVIELKYLIQFKVGTPIDQQRLIFHSNQLIDDNALSEYNIKHENTINMVLRLRGGMFHETSGKNGDYKPLEFMIIDIDIENISDNVSSVQFDI